MTDDILLVTTPASFGELIQQTLHESGRYQVTFTSNGIEAIQFGSKKNFVLGIFDAEVRDIPLSELVAYFNASSPQMRFIVIPPDNRPEDPGVSTLPIQDFLMKPFYLPNLLETVDRVLETNLSDNPVQQMSKGVDGNLVGNSRSSHIPAWLQDESKTSQILTSMSLECSAQGIFIVRGEQLWAYAGELNQPAAQEITRIIANYWTSSAGKFQGKKSDLARFVRLGANSGEYMLFATQLRGDMALGMIFEAETPFSQIRSQTYQVAHALVSPEGVVREKESIKLPRIVETSSVKPLLENIPPPMPGSSVSKQTGLREIQQDFVVDEEPDRHSLDDQKASKIKPVETFAPETRQQSALPVVYDLSYFCLLVPRMPFHQLNGDLAAKLSEWVGQLCMAYGWRLEHLSIRPEYMQWVVNVIPTVAPDHLMETLRKQTSERIFANFPEMGKDNPSGDFWAPGYLILTRIEQLSDQMIQGFINQVRQYQGTLPAYSYRMRR